MFKGLKSRTGMGGLLVATLEVEHPDKVVLEGVKARTKNWQETPDGLFKAVVTRRNAFVDKGLQITLDRLFGLGTPPAAISSIGVSSDATAVTNATVNLNGATGGTAPNTIIKTISPAASRATNTVTAGATFANADFTSGVFAIHKVGLLNTATDAGTGLIDVIGGSGSAPYNKPFTIDLTAAGTFSLTLQIQVTATAV